jgi:hypothetical protein
MLCRLSGYSIPSKAPRNYRCAPQFDAEAFAKLPLLKVKQATPVARTFQREKKLRHILPTAWERVLDDKSAFG